MTLNSAKTAHRQKRTKQWLVIILIVLLPLFFIGGPAYDASRSFKNFWNVGHILFFALFSYLILIDGRLFRNKSLVHKLLLCLLFATLLGIAIEYAQSGLHRDVDFNDLMRDLLGALLGFFLSPIALGKRARTTGLLSLAALLLFPSIPWFRELADEIHARQQFPVLSDFESDIEATRWSGDATIRVSDEVAFSGSHSLQVELGIKKYSGIALRYFPKDWSEYQTLIFELFNPDDNLEISVRIHDQLHTRGEQTYSDRFNQKLALHKGWNTVRIDLDKVAGAPTTRRMDLSAVGSLGLFVMEQKVPRRIYLDAVRLQK
jgi:VanZ family protein